MASVQARSLTSSAPPRGYSTPFANDGASRKKTTSSEPSSQCAVIRALTAVYFTQGKGEIAGRQPGSGQWFGTIPGYEVVNRELVVSSRMRRAKAIEDRGFCVIQVWELQNDFAAG